MRRVAICLLVIFVTICVSLGILLFIVSLPNLVLMGLGLTSSNAPEPQITYGEFPVTLEYEINGEIITVEDTVICEYDGQFFSTGSGEKERQWKTRLKSDNTRITLMHTADGMEIFYMDIAEFPAAIYMGEPLPDYVPADSINSYLNGTFPNAKYSPNFENKTVNSYIITAEEMWDKYQLKLISWEIASPIKNTFK